MTALCGGGPSEIIPGTQQLQNLIGSAIADALVAGEVSWFAAAASAVGYLTFDLASLCATDPPGFPNIDAARLAGYFNPLNPQGAQQLRDDALQMLETLLWTDYCQCVSGPQPSKPLPPSPPPGYQNNNPNVAPPGSPAACATYGPGGGLRSFLGTPPTVSIALTNFGIVPAGASGVTWEIQWQDWTPNVFPLNATLEVLYSGTTPSTINHSTIALPVAGQSTTLQCNIAGPVAQIQGILTNSQVTAADGFHSLETVRYFCGGATGQPGLDCCPPDPTLQTMILQVMQLEQLILDQLGGSKSYKRGTAHTGLTGTGTLSVTGLFGVLIELTSGVPTVPQLPGVPPYEFSVGWISCLTGDGMIDEVRITRQAQVWSSRLAPLATVFGYQLNAGFTATITELLPV